MIESLKIGKYIFDRIHNITGYTAYPCIADNDVKFPYIVYNRNGLSTQLTKDGYSEDTISFEISIYSDKYAQSIDVADAVRSALEVMSSTSDNILQIDNSIITNSNEQFINNTFVQNIQWSADITRYIDMSLSSDVDSIKFANNARYSYASHDDPEDYEVDLDSSIEIGTKYILYTTTSIDPYIVPITITQNDKDVTDECTFSFPTNKNIKMEYEDGNLIFTVKRIAATYFTTEVVVTKGDYSISIPFNVNFTIAEHQVFPNILSTDVFDVTKLGQVTLYGKAIGTDDILADGIYRDPHFIIEQDAPWPLNFGTLTVKEPKPEPTYNEWQDLSNVTYGRQGTDMYINMGDALNSKLWTHAYFAGGAFVVTDQMATDDTFTTFTKAIQANAYNSTSFLHTRMYRTTSSPESTFITNYDYSNVDHVDLKLQICTYDNTGLSNIYINGVVLDDYIVAQYGADWKDTVNWVSQTITMYNYKNDTTYNTHDVTCYDCCYLELTGIPIEVITNFSTTPNQYTGLGGLSTSSSALFYNFKFIRKQNS